MRFMKNLMKKISVVALVGVIISSSIDTYNGIVLYSGDPNPFIEVL